ncbi:MAG: polysaccharide-degrading enzyme, partial [Desulfamplus sp.]|nr:polysaccharide-degrading enzyme [Desulfamplus sp.]
LFIIALFSTYCSFSGAADYNVGPGQTYSAIGDVPWESLIAGDRVYIHWRSNSYNEKWVIGRSGTAQSPILISGVAGPEGQLPVIDGNNATTRQALNYWNENRGLIKIGGSNIPSETVPSHIIIENLDVRSARPPYTFTNDSGSQETYSKNAASIYVEIGQHLTIRNCIIRDSGNGIFIGANEGQTQEILIEGNYIYDNGIENSIYEHNTYTAAIGITYQYNFMGGLRSGAGGNNLKDRSAGLVIRYNWIENGNRQLDLVDAEDTDVLVNHPTYTKTYVYGNVLKEADGEGNSQMVHYGGDSGNEAIYRKGTLYFYNNTLISTRSGNTTMLRLSSNDEFADVHNNIVYLTAPGNQLALLSNKGQINIRHNWFKTEWRVSHDTFSGTITNDGSNIEGNIPGFVDFSQDDYHLNNSSQAKDAGIALHADLLTNHPLEYQYKYHRQGENRVNDNSIDIGAFEIEQKLKGNNVEILLLLLLD